MQGITLYLNDLEQARKWATDEELGRLLRIALDAAETETIPTFDNKDEDMLFDGFKKCLEKGIARVKTKRENGAKGGAPIGNQNAKKIKPNEGFDTTVSCYTPTQIVEKRSTDNEVDNNNLQLLLATLEEIKPQTNQTFKMVKWNNKAISNFVDKNRINEATQELAWKLYTSNNKN